MCFGVKSVAVEKTVAGPADEIAEGIGVVVTDGVELDALIVQVAQSVLQLNELREAGWSPNC